MRTTLTIEDDLARRLREQARRTRRSFKEVVNEVIARGLSAAEAPVLPIAPFRVEATAAGFRTGIDIRKLSKLVDELELERAGELIVRDR